MKSITRTLFLILTLSELVLSGSGRQMPTAGGPRPETAPAFVVRDIRGRTARLSDYKGKVVLLNFWATWCAPCRAEMPDLIRLQNEYQSRGLQVIGMTCPDYRRSDVSRIASTLKLNYPILLASRELAEKYGVSDVLPSTIVIDRTGKIRARILGILEPEEFEQSVRPLLD